MCFSPRRVCRCVPAGHWGSGSSAAWRLEQLGAGGVLQYGAALSLPSAAERLQRAGLHKLRGRISRLPGLHLHTAGQHAGNDTDTGTTVTMTNATTAIAFPTSTDINYLNTKLTCCCVCLCRWSRWFLCPATRRSPPTRLCPAWLIPLTTSPSSVTCAGNPDLWPQTTEKCTGELEFLLNWDKSEHGNMLRQTTETWTSREIIKHRTVLTHNMTEMLWLSSYCVINSTIIHYYFKSLIFSVGCCCRGKWMSCIVYVS